MFAKDLSYSHSGQNDTVLYKNLNSYQLNLVKKVQQIFYNPLEALFRKGSLRY